MEQINTKKIDLDMSKDISEIYRKYGYGDSAHAFNSMYIWAGDMKISAYICPDLYSGKFDDTVNTWFFPVGSPKEKKLFIEERLKCGNLSFKYMTKEDVSFVREYFPKDFLIEPSPDDSEYIYDRDTIENLPGKGLARKRRYVKQLLKEHVLKTSLFYDGNLPDVRYILDIWRRNKEEEIYINDKEATAIMLTKINELDIYGIVLYMDDVPCAVAAGYLLNDSTVDCCLQKSAVNEYGLQYYIRQQFSQVTPQSVKFYNYEEDLGLEGLRTAKEFMHPCAMVDMYTGKQI